MKTLEQQVKTLLQMKNNVCRPSFTKETEKEIFFADRHHEFVLQENGTLFKKLVNSGEWQSYGNIKEVGFINMKL